MKNKGFLSRSRIGGPGGHKETAVPPASLMEACAPVSPPVAEVQVEASPNRPPEVMPRGPLDPGSRRHTVLLRVPPETAARLARHLEQVTPPARSTARRAVISAFMRHYADRQVAPPNLTPAPMTAIRIDIRLSEARLAELLGAAAAAPYESTATVLARLLSPRFTAFLDQL